MTGQRRSAGDGGRQHESDRLIASSALVIVATRLRRGLDELQPRYAGPIADAW